MATKKKATTKKRDLLAGSVDAIEALEAIDGPLTFGRMLWSIRVGEHWTMAKMGKLLGVSAPHVADIEAGRRTVSAKRAARWAEVLGYMPTEFAALALQAELEAAGLPGRVRIEAA